VTGRTFVAGHAGFVGSAVTARMRRDRDVVVAARDRLDLRIVDDVRRFFERERPEHVVVAAGRSGGIAVNRARPGEFIHDNLAMQVAILDAARTAGVARLIFFACSCVYPRAARQPIAEDALLGGPLEPTSEAFAVAKLAGVKMVEAYNRQYGTQFVSVVPASVYGPGDDFDPATSHVLSALIRKFGDARGAPAPVTVWGTGAPRREFIFVDDVAAACELLLGLDAVAWRSLVDAPHSLVNIGVGEDVTIRELAGFVQTAAGDGVGYVFDPTAPDGAPRKLLDSARITRLGFRPATDLQAGIRRTWQWYTSADVRRVGARSPSR
jgi:GDP-L-fucose synthase